MITVMLSKEPLQVFGIDISRYQNQEIFDLDNYKDKLAFVICKATEGATYEDPNFQTNWGAIKRKDFIRGAYHFYHTTDDPGKQVNHFTDVVGGLEMDDIPLVVDFEGVSMNPKQSIDDIQKGLFSFLVLLEQKIGRKPVIYTDNNIGNKYLNNSKFSEYPLWIANYTTNSEPTLPKAWQEKGWRFWQKTDSYKIGNIKNDFDLFNGDLMALKEFIKNSVTTPNKS